MTVEELEIIITARVEEALKDFQKVIPEIKEMSKKATQAINNIDTNKFKEKVQQAVNLAKQRLANLKKQNENNKIAIKINTQEASKQVSQLQKEIDSLEKQINARQMKLNITNEALDKIRNETNQQVIKEMPDAGNKRIRQETYRRLDDDTNYNSLIKESDKLNNQISKYNSLLEIAKSKMSELNVETNKAGTSQNKLTSFFNSIGSKLKSSTRDTSSFKNEFNSLPKITSNIKNNIQSMGKGIKSGIGQVIKYAGALIGIRAVYSGLRSAASAWLSSQNAGAQQLNANIEYMKYAMGSALAPVIQFVTNLVYQLMKAVQSVAYALTGVNIFAKATASSMKSTAGSAKQASKSLSGVHNEINNVSENNGGSGGGATLPNLDLSRLDKGMSPMAQKLYDFFKPLKESWEKYGPDVIESAKNALGGIVQSAGAMWTSVEQIITNGTVYSIIENILNSIGEIGQAWANAWEKDNNGTEIVQGLANMLNKITEVVLNLVSSTGFQEFLDGIVSAFSGLVQFLQPVIDGFSEMAGKILEITMSAIGDLLQKIGDALQAIGKNETAVEILKAVGAAIAIVTAAIIAWNVAQIILNGLIALFNILTSPVTLIILAIVAAIAAIILAVKNWGAICEWFKKTWEELKTKLSEIWEGIKEKVTNTFNNIKDGIKNTTDSIKEGITDKFNKIKDKIVDTWDNVKSKTSEAWSSIKDKVKQGAKGAREGIENRFSNIGNWFHDKFSNAWQRVKDVFSKGGAIFDGIKEGILNGLKSVINAIIRGMNKVISVPFKGLNSALRKIRDINILGVSPFSWISTLNVPQIPELAKGGVLYDETLVMAGEYSGARSNPEIVTPQNIMYDTMRRALEDTDFSNTDGQSIYLTVNVGNKKLGQILLDDLRDKKRQTGKDIEALVGG